jgi:hypothetical protein
MNEFNPYRMQLVSLLLAIIVAGLAELSHGPAQPQQYRISGRISDRSGQGLSGVVVRLKGPNRLMLSGTTSRNGAFSFDGIPAGGPYQITTPSDLFRDSMPKGSGSESGMKLQFNVPADVIQTALPTDFADSANRSLRIDDFKLIRLD